MNTEQQSTVFDTWHATYIANGVDNNDGIFDPDPGEQACAAWQAATAQAHDDHQALIQEMDAEIAALERTVVDQTVVITELREAGQHAASAEAFVRYCPGCGSIGPIENKYRDCCPDGNESRMIPHGLAEKCQVTFRFAIRDMLAEQAANDTAPVAAQPSASTDLIAALRNQRQIDRDGTEVAVSRQAVDEAADLLDKLTSSSADGQAQQDADKVDANIRNRTSGNAQIDPAVAGNEWLKKARGAIIDYGSAQIAYTNGTITAIDVGVRYTDVLNLLNQRVQPASGEDADKVNAERQEWMTCESRRPFVVNSLKAMSADMRSAERRCRNAYRKDYMSLPTKFIADAYGEAAAILELRLTAIDAAMQQERQP